MSIKFPIYDHTGILLLAQGLTITPNFRRILLDRKISQVQVHNDDVRFLSATRPTSRPENSITKENCDPEVTKRLRQSVGNGLQFVTNNGSAAHEAVADHGDNNYCSQKLTELNKKSQAQCNQLLQLMNTVRDSNHLDGKIFHETTIDILKDMCEDFDCVNALSSNLTFDDSLAQHCHRMSVLGMSIAVEMGLNAENVCRVGVTGMLHDLGMLKVPEQIRNPSRPLNDAEQLELQKHVMYSVDLLEKTSGLPTLVPLVSYQIHEQINGNGYPRGRVGNNIHLFARILHVAHSYVELTTETVFRKALAPYDATIQLFRDVNNGILDPIVLRAFLRAQSLFPVGSMVMLSSGSTAKVIRANGDQFVDPVVQVVQNQYGYDCKESDEKVILNLLETDCKIVKAIRVLHDAEPIPAPHFLKADRASKKRRQKIHSR